MIALAEEFVEGPCSASWPSESSTAVLGSKDSIPLKEVIENA